MSPVKKKPKIKTISASAAARKAAQPQKVADKTPVGDISVGNMKIRSKTITAGVRDLITDMTIERGIDTAATIKISVFDRDRSLFKSGALVSGAVLSVNGMEFCLVAWSKNDNKMELTFEDRAVWALRQINKGTKAIRSSKMTRAKFIGSLVKNVRAPKIVLWSPELGIKQKVSKTKNDGPSQPYEFSAGQSDTNGRREDYWTAIRRLADEVQWRAFIVNNVLYLATDARILKESPKTVISSKSSGINNISWNIDEGKKAATCSIDADVKRWSVPPGSVIKINGEGPGNGLWIVSNIRRPISSVRASISLARPRPALPEPAATTRTMASGATGNEDAPPQIQSAYAKADSLARQNIRYTKGSADCSWWASQILMAAGMLGGRTSTGPLMTWGVAGEGYWMTVWVKNNPADAFRGSHTFIEFKGFPHRWSESGGGPSIGGWRSSKSTGGYTARHWSGM